MNRLGMSNRFQSGSVMIWGWNCWTGGCVSSALILFSLCGVGFEGNGNNELGNSGLIFLCRALCREKVP